MSNQYYNPAAGAVSDNDGGLAPGPSSLPGSLPLPGLQQTYFKVPQSQALGGAQRYLPFVYVPDSWWRGREVLFFNDFIRLLL